MFAPASVPHQRAKLKGIFGVDASVGSASSQANLRAPARAAAAHALITAAVSHHDRAAEAARRRVAQVDDAG